MRIGHRHTGLRPSKQGPKTWKSSSGNQTASPLSKGECAQHRSHQRMGWTIGALLIAAGGIGGSGWMAVNLIVNPQAMTWLNRLIPNWVPVSVPGSQSPQTLQAIQAGIRQTGRIPGEPLPLGKNKSFLDGQSTVSDVLIPLLVQPAQASKEAANIVELRLYQAMPMQVQKGNSPALFQLVKQLAIAGPPESFVIAPLVNAQSTSQGTARALPLTTLKRFEDKVPAQGVWLNLTGLWSRRDETVAYGQIIHYNPDRLYLSLMLEWSSTNGQMPLWQEISGNKIPELVVDQTMGMEPQFRVYQVKPRNFLPEPIQLEPISLVDPVLSEPNYNKALLLARNGLWSTAWQWLQSCKQENQGKSGQWSAAAQAQMDLVQLHAQITQAQADQSWASPNQQILANLIDGRWNRALYLFKASPDNSLETVALLRADSGQIQNRVEATLQINPNQREAKTWGALLIAAQKDSSAAIGWLKKQPKTTKADITQISQLIKRLEASGDK
ncbi:MAG: hypothetical protein WCA35_05040 [Kovacikia sp.]